MACAAHDEAFAVCFLAFTVCFSHTANVCCPVVDSVQSPVEDSIDRVIQVGQQTIGISGTFQCVYCLTSTYGRKGINTTQSFEMESKVLTFLDMWC